MLDTIAKSPTIKGHYINGEWTAGGSRFADPNPSDGSTWTTVPDAGVTETRSAITAAQNAFAGWSALKFTERAHFMLKMADIL